MISKVRIPQIASIEVAIRLYYSRTELSNADMRELFGANLSKNKASQLKKVAWEKMIEEKTPVWNAAFVNTDVAFRAWGLNIADLEARQKKLAALGR